MSTKRKLLLMADYSLIPILEKMGYNEGNVITIPGEIAAELNLRFKIQELIGQEHDDHEFLFLKSGKFLKRVSTDTVIFAKANGSYTEVFTTDEQFLLSFNLRIFMKRVSILGMIRVHRSHAINPRKLKGIVDNKLTVADYEVPVSKSYRNQISGIINVL